MRIVCVNVYMYVVCINYVYLCVLVHKHNMHTHAFMHTHNTHNTVGASRECEGGGFKREVETSWL